MRTIKCLYCLREVELEDCVVVYQCVCGESVEVKKREGEDGQEK